MSETLLEILQGASGPEASALFDEWTARLRPLRGEPAGASTLCAVLCCLTHVSAIPRPRISAAAEALPEPEKETFMTAAQGWMLEGLEKGRQEGRQEGERAVFAPMLLMQARLRFRDVPLDVPLDVTTRIEAATKPDLERWIERILNTDQLDDLFGQPATPRGPERRVPGDGHRCSRTETSATAAIGASSSRSGMCPARGGGVPSSARDVSR